MKWITDYEHLNDILYICMYIDRHQLQISWLNREKEQREAKTIEIWKYVMKFKQHERLTEEFIVVDVAE